MPSSPFLNNFIYSLNSRQQTQVTNLLQVAISSKTDITTLATTLGAVTNFTSFVPVGMIAYGLITGSDWFLNYRNINLLLNDLFNTFNQVGLLLDTNQKMLLSQLAAAEKQLSAMEKQAANFEFLLGTGSTFNYAYTETFHDLLGQATNFAWAIPDRDGLGFDSTYQIATVLTSSGELILPQDVGIPGAGISVSLASSNAAGYVVNDTGVANVLTNQSNTGWSYTIIAPTPISSSLDPVFGSSTGAQVVLEFTLSEPSSCSQIRIVPLASETIELVDIIGFSSVTDTVGFSIQGTNNVDLTQGLTITFPLTTIQRFRVYLNQSEYVRIITNNNSAESQFNQLYSQSNDSTKTINNLGNNQLGLTAFSEGISNFPTIANTNVVKNDLDIVDILRLFRTRLGPQSQWNKSSIGNNTFLHLYSQYPGVFKTMFSNSTQMPGSVNKTNINSQITPLASITNNAPAPINAYPTGVTNVNPTGQYGYQYLLGLQSVSVGVSIPEYKGVFVSVVIPSEGDMGTVVLNESSTDYIDTTNTLDNPILTSIEYSVTNISNPINENNWIPIQPLDKTSVASERLFPNAAGFCNLRFTANASEQILVYKNGYIFSNYTTQLDVADENVVGISLVVSSYAPQDIFTVSYTPLSTANTVDFSANGFANIPLLSASDNNGAGEGFSATVGNNTIQLNNIPFINSALIVSSSYQPISIVLNDGTVATNLTNYVTGVQPVFPASGYYYIQSGNTILFNQAISQPFRVYYQYLQNNVCFRVVLRSNSINLVSPIVNLVQLKAETRLPSAVQSF